MNSIFGTNARSVEENARLAGPKPVVAAAAPVVRRALGDIGNGGGAAPVAAGGRAVIRTGVHEGPFTPAELNVDAADIDEPATASEYVSDIYAFLKAQEATRCASSQYMKSQTDINEKMRAILIDWLVEVHLKFKLMPETMYLTVNIIDRYLEKKQVIRQKLQLVGVTAMLLASKYEEIYAPEVRDFVYITDKAYTKEQILAMEASMLNTLEFRITVPTSFVFLNRYLKVASAAADPIRLGFFATYLAERMLQEHRMLSYTPSRVAAAAANIALRTIRGSAVWDRKLEHHTGFTQEALRPCIKDIEELMAAQPNSLKAVMKKYALPKFGEVSGIAIVPLA